MKASRVSPFSEELRRRFSVAQRIYVLTGAGVSAESGVPTFRGGGSTAVWKGLPFEVISSARMLERDLDEVWRWFAYRRSVIGALGPNAAHAALARWQDRFVELTLATQNVDGLHRAAGSRHVIELHGNIWRARCTGCGAREEIRDELGHGEPPPCGECGNRMRPDVVLFGEMLPAGAFEYAARRAEQCELCFVVGTSGLVYPAAGLPRLARAAGAYVVEVNPEPTTLSARCDEALRGRAAELLPLFEV